MTHQNETHNCWIRRLDTSPKLLEESSQLGLCEREWGASLERASESDPRSEYCPQDEVSGGESLPPNSKRFALRACDEGEQHQRKDETRDNEGVDALSLVLFVHVHPDQVMVISNNRGDVNDEDDSTDNEESQSGHLRGTGSLRPGTCAERSGARSGWQGQHGKETRAVGGLYPQRWRHASEGANG